MSGRLKAYCCLSAAMVIVGSSVVVGRIAALRLPVFLALGLRFAVACLLVLPLLRRREGGLPRLSVRHWAVLFGQTFCGVFLFNVLLLHGLRLTGAATAGIMTSTTPAWMGILALAFLGERPGGRAWLGILLSVAGTLAVTFQGAAPDATQEAQPLLGGLLALGAVLGEACFLLLRKALPASLSALGAAAAVSLLGLAQFLIPALWQAAAFDWSSLAFRDLVLLLYYGAVVTVLAYVLWFAGVVRVPAGTAGVFTGIMPVSALVLSWAVLDEPLGWRHAAGCAAVLGGIALLSGPARGLRTGWPEAPAGRAAPGPGPADG